MSDNEVTERYISSLDGSRIGFSCRGSGPGLLLVQGAMGTAYHLNDMARALAPYFTVYTPDQRGRGMSAKLYDSEHDIARDVEDVDAILAETGACMVFGLSSGAIIVLEAARTLSRVIRAVVYEPPFYPMGIDHAGIRQLNAEIERGQLALAMATALVVAETAPWPLQESPYAKLRDLVPSLRYDFNIVGEIDGRMDTFASIKIPRLLIRGTKSPAFLQQSTQNLADTIPQAQSIELDDFEHSGPWNGSRGGDPTVIAAILKDFFE